MNPDDIKMRYGLGPDTLIRILSWREEGLSWATIASRIAWHAPTLFQHYQWAAKAAGYTAEAGCPDLDPALARQYRPFPRPDALRVLSTLPVRRRHPPAQRRWGRPQGRGFAVLADPERIIVNFNRTTHEPRPARHRSRPPRRALRPVQPIP